MKIIYFDLKIIMLGISLLAKLQDYNDYNNDIVTMVSKNNYSLYYNRFVLSIVILSIKGLCGPKTFVYDKSKLKSKLWQGSYLLLIYHVIK